MVYIQDNALPGAALKISIVESNSMWPSIPRVGDRITFHGCGPYEVIQVVWMQGGSEQHVSVKVKAC